MAVTSAGGNELPANVSNTLRCTYTSAYGPASDGAGGWERRRYDAWAPLADAVGAWRDRDFDARHGVSTAGVTELSNLVVTGPNRERGIRYEPTRARPFTRLLEALQLPRHGGFVDFGCGKGRVLVMAADYGFERLVGVDFAAALCREARHNLERRARRKNRRLDVEIVHGDAVDLAIDPRDVVFYFFNPFDDVVLRRVLDNILRSYDDVPRGMHIIYHNPVCRRVLDLEPALTCIGDHTWEGCRFVVYRARGPEHA